MTVRPDGCPICAGTAVPEDAGRYVWEDDLWRLWTVTRGSVAGFSVLTPKRHIAHITDLDGDEARTLGTVLARLSRTLRDVTRAEVVYLYVFGTGIAHLHIHLAPHRQGDALNGSPLRGRTEERRLPSGAALVTSLDFPELPADELVDAAERLRRALAEWHRSRQ